jgi:hypothetical protein
MQSDVPANTDAAASEALGALSGEVAVAVLDA